MRRARARRDLPPFLDVTLRVPTRLHEAGCPGSIQKTGLPPVGRCRCDIATSIAPAGIEGTMHIRDDGNRAILVSFDGYGPAWYESKGIRTSDGTSPVRMTEDSPDSPVDVQPDEEPDRRPLDLQLLDRWMKEHGNPKYGRRRRPIEGGELVFVRSERMEGVFEPWRFVFSTRKNNEHIAVLLKPELMPEAAITPAWEDVRFVPMPAPKSGELSAQHRVLFPVFPLPDGSDTPGWKRP